MASSSELGVSSSITKCDVVEYESLQTPPTLRLETPLADVYAGVVDSTSGSETDIAATETIYLSTSAYPMSDNNVNEAGNNEQHTDLKLDTPDNSLTQIFVLHQPASLTLTDEDSYQAFVQHETNIKLDEQMHTHVDEPGCSLENITEIEESSGIVLVMPGDCQLLSVNNSLPQCMEDKSIINRDVQTTKSPLKETSSMIKPGSTTTMEHQVCLQLVKEDGSTCSLNVIPGKLHDVKSESNCDTLSSETTVINNVPRDDRLFMCDLCSKTFNRPGNYKRHRMTHMVNTEEDPRYKCEVCNRPFLQRCDLKRHMQVHSGKEPFRCQVCDKGYIRRSDLVVHMRFHNKERLFKCDYCEKKFHQSGDLKRHVRLVHVKTTKLLCRHCDSRYATDTTFLRHMQTAHRDILLQSLDKVLPLDDPVADVSDNNSWRSDSKESSASADASPSGSKKELYEVSSSSSSISSSVSYTISSSFSS